MNGRALQRYHGKYSVQNTKSWYNECSTAIRLPHACIISILMTNNCPAITFPNLLFFQEFFSLDLSSVVDYIQATRSDDIHVQRGGRRATRNSTVTTSTEQQLFNYCFVSFSVRLFLSVDLKLIVVLLGAEIVQSQSRQNNECKAQHNLLSLAWLGLAWLLIEEDIYMSEYFLHGSTTSARQGEPKLIPLEARLIRSGPV